MNKKYVVDAYAWVEYLIGSEAGSKVRAILEKEDNEIYTCAVTVAEVISKAIREGRNPETAYEIIVSDSYIINIDEELSKDAGMLHAEMRKTVKDFGLADAYVLASAKNKGLVVITGDVHFKGIKEAILIR